MPVCIYFGEFDRARRQFQLEKLSFQCVSLDDCFIEKPDVQCFSLFVNSASMKAESVMISFPLLASQ